MLLILPRAALIKLSAMHLVLPGAADILTRSCRIAMLFREQVRAETAKEEKPVEKKNPPSPSQALQQTRFGEQRLLQSSQKYPAVADTSVLRGEMELLEPEGEDAEPRKLYYAPLTFLSHVGSHSIEWPLDVWQTFFSSSLGVSVPILVNHPRTLCACKKHLLGHLPDHVHCCQSVAASTQAHDCACQRRLQQAGGSSAAMSR